VKVATDGSINLPDVGVFRCEGLTVNQLRDRLADKYRAANHPGADDLVVARLGKSSSGGGGGAAAAADLDAVAQVDATTAQRGRMQMRRSAQIQPRQGNGNERYARAGGSDPRESETLVNRSALAEETAEATGQPADSQPAAPSTSPASTSPADGEERVDLVIVVRRADGAGADATATGTAPSEPEPTGPIARYEFLSLTVGGDAAAPGAEEPDVTNVQVAEDGMIEVPEVGRLKAEGRTSADLERELGETLAKKKANPTKVRVSRLGTGSSTNAATQPDAAGAAPPPQPPPSEK
jgi:hypothetical protein